MALKNNVSFYVNTGEPEAKQRRVSKADRPLTPPSIASELGIELRPDRYQLDRLVLEHYSAVNYPRSNNSYAQRWNEFYFKASYERLVAAEQEAREREAKNNGTDPNYKRGVRPSELKECRRKTVYRLRGNEHEEQTGIGFPEWNVAATVGTRVHEEIELALQFLGVSSESEFVLKTEDETLSGRVDHKINPYSSHFDDLPDEQRVDAILDVKTVSSKYFEQGTYSEKVRGYIDQVSAYAYLTGCPLGIVLLVDRSTGKMFSFEWDVPQQHAKNVVRLAKELVEMAAETDVLPPPDWFEKGRPSFKCFNFCPFRQACFAQEGV